MSSSADDEITQKPPHAPIELSTAADVLGTFLGTLPVVAIAFITLQR
jgi:hypothetical protein